jgi:ferredoxin
LITLHFDPGFIGFEDSGRLIISPVAHRPSLQRMGIAPLSRLTSEPFARGKGGGGRRPTANPRLDQTAGTAHFLEMTKLQAARTETTEAFLANSGPELSALCTACGACFNACPMVDYLGLRGSDPKSVTQGLRALARGESAPADAISWVGGCTKSGLCVAACPESSAGLNAMLFIRIAKQRALNDTRQLPIKHDPTYFPRLKIFAQLQLSEEELTNWL